METFKLETTIITLQILLNGLNDKTKMTKVT